MQHICIKFLTTPKELTGLELDCNGMPLLNHYNWNIVDACIQKLPNYNGAHDIYQKILNKQGTTLMFNRNDVYEIIKKIAVENSTRTPDKSIDAFVNYITNKKLNFWGELQSGNIELPDMIYNFVKEKSNRKEKSLASKICKFLNDWIYNKKDYTINDSFVRGVLPYYLAYHGVNSDIWIKSKGNKKVLQTFEDEIKPYKFFWRGFNSLMQELNNKKINLSPHQVDNIVWFCFRDDGVRFEMAKGLAKSFID